jgi:cold shock CspA family protein
LVQDAIRTAAAGEITLAALSGAVESSEVPCGLHDLPRKGEEVTGKIARIVEEKGLGFIAGEDGEDYVFHRSALLEGEPFDQLLQGAPVTFDTVHQPKGLRAEAVRVVKSDV